MKPSMIRFAVACLALVGGLLPCQSAWAQSKERARGKDAADKEKLAFFESDVLPILKANCFECHGGGEKLQGQFRITSRAGLLTGGELGPAVSLEKPDESRLLEAINYGSLEMPPSGKLAAREIEILTRWVKMGSPYPPGKDYGAAASSQPRASPQVNEEARNFWAFRPVKRPAVPEVKNKAWVRSAIDTFILRGLEKNGLTPAAPADKVALIRRATYDLTGLPPTPSEVDAFVADDSPEAFARVVDRLLESPRYGERWGRHWLDLVRFAETNSFERDGVKPEAWRFRDYVIRSFNNDKPYDQFVVEQLAGDELDPVTADSLIATGFYRIGIWDDEPTDRLQAKYDELDDIVTTAGQAFLGLTVNCARCHDHKLDPFPQADYYRFLAFFHGVTQYGLTKQHELGHILALMPGDPKQKVLCVTEAGAKAPDTHVFIRGNAHSKGERVEPGFPQVLTPAGATGSASARAPQIVRPKHGRSSGRRLALARWIASPENQLTARVMANRIWQHHFGRGIVRSSNNFGQIGDRPTHPALLDWLASEFIDRGWRLKEMHRLIMLSSAYQMSSRGSAAGLARDPQNDLFWRFDMRRLAAEEIRDSILAVNGRLNLKMGGPSIYTTISREVLAGQSMPGHGWGKSPPEEESRRSIYIHVKRSLITPILETFDFADTDSTCPVRFSTTQATQALGMLNGEFINGEAKAFAARVRKEGGPNPADQVRLAFHLATARKASAAEVERALRLMRRLESEERLSGEASLEQFCLLVLNLNEFMYLD
jgi:mono/diheme cytochrome c family protein